MRVFLSWSGPQSRAIAEALHAWLPDVIQALDPWVSTASIEKGTRWADNIAKELEGAKVGISCLTPDNQTAPWLLFEAGALAKTIEDTYVCTYLYQLDYTDVKPPLSQFQHTKAERDDTKKLLLTINKALQKKALAEELVERAFERGWPELENKLQAVEKLRNREAPKKRLDRELLEETLEIVRGLARTTSASETDARQRLSDFLRGASLDASKQVRLRPNCSLDELIRRHARPRSERSQPGGELPPPPPKQDSLPQPPPQAPQQKPT